MKEVLQILAWPGCVIVCVVFVCILFRQQVASLLDRAEEINKGGIKARAGKTSLPADEGSAAAASSTGGTSQPRGVRFFLTTPLSGIGNQEQYSAFMERMRPILTKIRALKGVEHVYYFNEMIPTFDEFHQDKWSVPDYFNEIEQADYMVLVTDSSNVSAVYYEAGYALAKGIKAIYFVGPHGKIPHLMHQCVFTYPKLARHQEFKELEQVPELLRRVMPALQKEEPNNASQLNSDPRRLTGR